jgi:hypothetical protein
VLLATQALAMLQSLALAALTLTHRVNIHEILWLSAFQCVINAFDMPGRKAFLVQIVEDKLDLGNAIAINSSMVNVARLVGPDCEVGDTRMARLFCVPLSPRTPQSLMVSQVR